MSNASIEPTPTSANEEDPNALVDKARVAFEYQFAIVDELKAFAESGTPVTDDARLGLSDDAVAILKGPVGREEVQLWLAAFSRTFFSFEYIGAMKSEDLGYGVAEWERAIKALEVPLRSLRVRLTSLAHGEAYSENLAS